MYHVVLNLINKIFHSGQPETRELRLVASFTRACHARGPIHGLIPLYDADYRYACY